MSGQEPPPAPPRSMGEGYEQLFRELKKVEENFARVFQSLAAVEASDGKQRDDIDALEVRVNELERAVGDFQRSLELVESRVRRLRDESAEIANRNSPTDRPPPPVLGDADELEPLTESDGRKKDA